MVDFNDVNEFINVFLNDLVHSSDSLFRLEYTKKSLYSSLNCSSIHLYVVQIIMTVMI